MTIAIIIIVVVVLAAGAYFALARKPEQLPGEQPKAQLPQKKPEPAQRAPEAKPAALEKKPSVKPSKVGPQEEEVAEPISIMPGPPDEEEARPAKRDVAGFAKASPPRAADSSRVSARSFRARKKSTRPSSSRWKR